MKRPSVPTGLLLGVVGLALVIPFVSPSQPILGRFLASVSVLLSVAVMLLWGWVAVRVVLKAIPRKRVNAWIKRHLPQRKKTPVVVPVHELAELCRQVRAIKRALFGITAEQEELPALPPGNERLYTDYIRLTAVMEMLGFPEVGRIRLREEDFGLLTVWANDLAQRIPHPHLHTIVATSLDRLLTECQQMGTTETTPAYFRLLGAVKVVERIAQDSRVPTEVVNYCTQVLQNDLKSVRQHLHAGETLATHS